MLTSNYEIVIQGEIGSHVWPAFAPARLSVADGRTTIHASDIDQAALHGIFDVARSLGLALVGVRRLDQVT